MGSHTDDGWIPAPTLPSVGNSAGPSTGPAAAWRDSPLPSPAVGAADLPVIRTAPHLTGIAMVTSTCPTNVRFVSGYQYIETLGLLYPINRIVNNVTA